MLKRTFTDSDFRVVHYGSRSGNPPHMHADYTLTYHFRGVARSRVGSDGIFEFHPGDVNLLNPGEVHKDFASSLERECLMVGVGRQLFEDVLKELGRYGSSSFHFPSPKERSCAGVRQVCQSIKSEVDGQLPGRDTLVRCMATELVVELLRQIQPSALVPDPFSVKGAAALWPVRRAIEYLHDNFQEKFELSQVADATKLSKYYLERVFKEATGYPLHTYAMNLRIDRAKELLIRTNKSLVSIALELGFSDQSHFTNVFRRFVGLSPGTYRSNSARPSPHARPDGDSPPETSRATPEYAGRDD